MIEWLRKTVRGRAYSEIGKAIAGKIETPLILVWIGDIAWEIHAGGKAMEMCLAQVTKNSVGLDNVAGIAQETCERWLNMQDFGIPDPILFGAWGFWVLMIAIYYHNRNKPYPWGPNR